MRLLACFFLVLVWGVGGACVEGGTDFTSVREVTLSADTGINMVTGEFQEKGNFDNSDVYATAGSTHLKLSSGGKITNPRDVTFFLGAGGVHATFESLDAVPNEAPETGLNAALVKAKPGNGFVVLMSNGSYAKGWVREADANELHLEYIHLPAGLMSP